MKFNINFEYKIRDILKITFDFQLGWHLGPLIEAFCCCLYAKLWVNITFASFFVCASLAVWTLTIEMFMKTNVDIYEFKDRKRFYTSIRHWEINVNRMQILKA